MFAHRKNLDGTWDSICLTCFLNVIACPCAGREDELRAHEATHRCLISQHDMSRLLVSNSTTANNSTSHGEQVHQASL